jgi:hypothetical protein
VHLVGFIMKKFVTVHMNVKCVETYYITCSLSSVDSFTWLKESEELVNYFALILFAKLSSIFRKLAK